MDVDVLDPNERLAPMPKPSETLLSDKASRLYLKLLPCFEKHTQVPKWLFRVQISAKVAIRKIPPTPENRRFAAVALGNRTMLAEAASPAAWRDRPLRLHCGNLTAPP
jgi:hypothetical protein